jgi:catechol 2,3-dioxygenase-like lactoylglutathione lyase family enzyme
MIHHATREIPPSKLDRSVEFYGLLGFVPVPVPPGIAGRALWLEHAGTQIHLMPVDGASRQTGHVAVVVENYEGTLAALRAAGYEVEPRREHWGSPRSYVRDPAENLVELMAWPPGQRE